MGVLCHPNFEDEKANGVGVSVDPLYNTDNTFYLNSQIGEELITNPNGSSIPEEILLDRDLVSEIDHIIIQGSNFIPSDSIIMSAVYRTQMREFFNVIHDEFAILYKARPGDNFAMDIEYKITADDQLIIKQARPWLSFMPSVLPIPETEIDNPLVVYPNPTKDMLSIYCESCSLDRVIITDMLGRRWNISVTNAIDNEGSGDFE